MKDDYVKIPEITFMTGINYKTILLEVSPERKVTICTYSLYGSFEEYYYPALKDIENVELVINRLGKYRDFFVKQLPNVQVHETDRSHAKMLLIEPDEVYLSSQNFGESDWFQHAVHIKDTRAYDRYHNNVIGFIEGGFTGNIAKRTDSSSEKSFNSPSGFINPDEQGTTCKNVYGKYMTTTNWNQKINSVRNRYIIITTYTLPDIKYVHTILDRLIFDYHNQVCIYGNSLVESKLNELSKRYPICDFEYQTFQNMHAKMILYDNLKCDGGGTALLSSQNLGTSGWFENLILVKDGAYQYYSKKLAEFVKGAK